MPSYIVKQTEPALWTTGFNDPSGTWHPESDHDSRAQAGKRTAWLNGINGTGYIYRRTEPLLWTTGCYGPKHGQWFPESDHGSSEEAAQATAALNGSDPQAWRENSVSCSGDARTRLFREDQVRKARDHEAGRQAKPDHDVGRQVEAVLDVIAPRPDLPAGELAVLGLSPDTRVPVIRFDYEGRAVMPSDAQIRALAEEIVTAIRTAGGAS